MDLVADSQSIVLGHFQEMRNDAATCDVLTTILDRFFGKEDGNEEVSSGRHDAGLVLRKDDFGRIHHEGAEPFELLVFLDQSRESEEGSVFLDALFEFLGQLCLLEGLFLHRGDDR